MREIKRKSSSTSKHIQITEPVTKKLKSDKDLPPARIALIGTGWWGQGWHLKHLSSNPEAELAAIVDCDPNPSSALNPNLLSLAQLGDKYQCPTFESVEALLEATQKKTPKEVPQKRVSADRAVAAASVPSPLELDGVIICTPHATHYEVGAQVLNHRSQLHILMEKPFTTDVAEARALVALANDQKPALSSDGEDEDEDAEKDEEEDCEGFERLFSVNHSANSREQAKAACEVVAAGRIGEVQHVTCFFGSALLWLFSDPKVKAWNEPSGTMLGNGFGWGQMAHPLAWVFRVTNLTPKTVSCSMVHSSITGADIHDSVIITCEEGGATVCVSGTASVPGDEHAKTRGGGEEIGKLFDVKVFGSKGALFYGGDDKHPNSGVLELRLADEETGGARQVLCPTFEFEDCADQGHGPASVRLFVQGCRERKQRGGRRRRDRAHSMPSPLPSSSSSSLPSSSSSSSSSTSGHDAKKNAENRERGSAFQGADAQLGLVTTQVIEAMYRSALANGGKPVHVL